MKRITVSIIALSMVVTCYSQGADSFLKNWTDLESQFLIKSDASKNIAILAMDSKKVNVTFIEKIIGSSFGLNQVIRIVNEPDKPGVQRIAQFDDSLDYYLSIVIKAIKKDQQFPSPKAYAAFEKTFLDANTKLEVYKYDFSQACRKINKPELAFPNKSGSEISF